MTRYHVAGIIGIAIVVFLILLVFTVYPAMNRLNEENHRNALEKENRTFSGTGINAFSLVIGNITIDMTLPESPHDMRIYRGYFQEGDLVNNGTGGLKRIKNPVPVSQAPAVAEQLLAPYSGLPTDAILLDNFVEYSERLNRTTLEVIERIPEGTFVAWYRKIDGIDLEGDGDVIQVDMGENGTARWIHKRWRTYEPLENVSIISASKAIDKLKAGEVMNPESSIKQDVSIYNMHLSYYIPGHEELNVTTEPIWVFYGNASGNYVPFYVYARQFANFTVTPATGTVPLTVALNDTSDASPTKWLWDFGDGTNSTVRNVTHVYASPGTYNITLTAWNDLGSDTMTKTGLIQVSLPTLIANFTATPATGAATFPVQFTDTSSASANRWFWDFGDNTNSTVQHVAHTYASPGTYNVTHQVWNNYGNDTISRQYLVNNRSSMLYPNTKYLEYSTVLANTSYYATIDGVQWQNKHFFGIVGNGHFNSTSNPKKAYNWTRDPLYSNRYHMEQLRYGSTWYPANLVNSSAGYQWVFTDGLSPNAYTSYNDDYGGSRFGELGGYVNSFSGTYYLWYGNTTAACDPYGWLFPTYENATYLVKINVIWR